MIEMGQTRFLPNGEMIIKTEEGIFFHAFTRDSMPILIDEEEGKALFKQGIEDKNSEPKVPKTYSLRLNGEYYGTGDFAYMIELMHEWVVIRGMYGKGEVGFEIVDETKRKPTLTEKVIAHRLGKGK